MTSLPLILAQRQPIPLPTTSFSDQTMIVTGANTGLGFEAAKHFVRLGATLAIPAVWQVDMDLYDSLKAFAAKCSNLEKLDVVVANAGVLRNSYEVAEGTEITIAVNVIATFLLVLNLLPILRRSGTKTGKASRLVITSSLIHEDTKFADRREPSIFEAFKKNKKSYMDDRHNVSKLMEVFLVRSIADVIKKVPHATEPLILNNVNPGLCHLELSNHVQGVAAFVTSVAKLLLARTTEVGSAAAGKESHGELMSEAKVKQPSAFVRSKEGVAVQARIHKELMDILETMQPNISKNI